MSGEGGVEQAFEINDDVFNEGFALVGIVRIVDNVIVFVIETTIFLLGQKIEEKSRGGHDVHVPKSNVWWLTGCLKTFCRIFSSCKNEDRRKIVVFTRLVSLCM